MSILAGTPCAFILSILIHGMWHLRHLAWSGNAPVMLGGNLSRVFCLLQPSAKRAKRAEPYLQLSPSQPRFRRSSALYIVSQPNLRSSTAAFSASSVQPADWPRRGGCFSLVLYIHMYPTSWYWLKGKGASYRLFPV